MIAYSLQSNQVVPSLAHFLERVDSPQPGTMVSANNGSMRQVVPAMQLRLTDEFGNQLDREQVAGKQMVATVREEEEDANAVSKEIFLDFPFLFCNDAARFAQVTAAISSGISIEAICPTYENVKLAGERAAREAHSGLG